MMHSSSFFFYAYAKWKTRIYCDSWTSTRIEVLGREGLVSPMCGCTLCLGLPYKNSGLRWCSTRQPTVYSYTASHRSPCIRMDSPTQFHLHQHHVHYHTDSQINNSVNIEGETVSVNPP